MCSFSVMQSWQTLCPFNQFLAIFSHYLPQPIKNSLSAVLASDVYDGFERGDETLVAALDLEDAYNRVSYKILMTTLMNMKVNPVLIVWIGSTMLKRKVALRVGSWISEVKEITPGLPQGSALSPVLFNVYTVGVTSNQLEGPGRTLSFADDVLTYRQGRDRQDIASGL